MASTSTKVGPADQLATRGGLVARPRRLPCVRRRVVFKVGILARPTWTGVGQGHGLSPSLGRVGLVVMLPDCLDLHLPAERVGRPALFRPATLDETERADAQVV